MPLVSSDYRPPLHLRYGHLSTIYSGLFRKIGGLVQKRERLELTDGDYIDLDWSFAKPLSTSESGPMATGGSFGAHSYQKVAVLLHGLEGNAQRPYITGSAKAFNEVGIDACAVNFRGCSGETNRLYRSYHSGATEDLDAVVQHIIRTKKYSEIYIKGVSLGGNMALKYVGEPRNVPEQIKAVIAISAPCNLYSSLKELTKPKNFAYAVRFRKHLVDKLRLKLPLFPEKISETEIKGIGNLKDFDDVYTAPAHGFKNAIDYYEQCSCRQFLPNVRVPSLIINAVNDSFLGTECYPYEEAKANQALYFETPKFGGHVGFIDSGNRYYSEKRAIKFLEESI